MRGNIKFIIQLCINEWIRFLSEVSRGWQSTWWRRENGEEKVSEDILCHFAIFPGGWPWHLCEWLYLILDTTTHPAGCTWGMVGWGDGTWVQGQNSAWCGSRSVNHTHLYNIYYQGRSSVLSNKHNSPIIYALVEREDICSKRHLIIKNKWTSYLHDIIFR